MRVPGSRELYCLFAQAPSAVCTVWNCVSTQTPIAAITEMVAATTSHDERDAIHHAVNGVWTGRQDDRERNLEAVRRAAARADFVVALYNPVSKRRTKQLARARDILLSARPPETPVILARNLGRFQVA